MEIVDQFVYADLLLINAKRCGINISTIVEDPMSVSTSKKCKAKELGLMIETESSVVCV